jgi:hypothetical protein
MVSSLAEDLASFGSLGGGRNSNKLLGFGDNLLLLRRVGDGGDALGQLG